VDLDFLIKERDFLDRKTKETTSPLGAEIDKLIEDKKKKINQLVQVFMQL
jgi:hypothetical protein